MKILRNIFRTKIPGKFTRIFGKVFKAKIPKNVLQYLKVILLFIEFHGILFFWSKVESWANIRTDSNSQGLLT